MSQTLEEKRVAELTDRIADFLCEGEEFLIRCQDDEIEVIPTQQASPLRRSHEELYGFMLSVNQQLREAAIIPRWIVRLLLFSLIIALHLDWLSGLGLPFQLSKLQSWWVYGLIVVFGYAVNSMLKEWRQHQIYGHWREELLKQLNEYGIPRYRLLTQVEGDDSLDELTMMLKKDHAQEARY